MKDREARIFGTFIANKWQDNNKDPQECFVFTLSPQPKMYCRPKHSLVQLDAAGNSVSNLALQAYSYFDELPVGSLLPEDSGDCSTCSQVVCVLWTNLQHIVSLVLDNAHISVYSTDLVKITQTLNDLLIMLRASSTGCLPLVKGAQEDFVRTLDYMDLVDLVISRLIGPLEPDVDPKNPLNTTDSLERLLSSLPTSSSPVLSKSQSIAAAMRCLAGSIDVQKANPVRCVVVCDADNNVCGSFTGADILRLLGDCETLDHVSSYLDHSLETMVNFSSFMCDFVKREFCFDTRVQKYCFRSISLPCGDFAYAFISCSFRASFRDGDRRKS